MARYYSYGRGRYGRRYYRRGYRRYGGTSLRRYRSVQMNDDETKVMTFSSVVYCSPTLENGQATLTLDPAALLAGTGPGNRRVVASSGRPYFAGMMFDRMRYRSLWVSIRPLVMPDTTASNYNVYAAWDRYGRVSSTGVPNYSIATDPSAKQVVWTSGGSGTPLRTWIYATGKDRYQYASIKHDETDGSWYPFESSGIPDIMFNPVLLIAVVSAAVPDTTPRFSVHARITIEFQGGYSNTTLNYTSASGLSAAAAYSAEEITNAQPTQTSYAVSSIPQTVLPAISRR